LEIRSADDLSEISDWKQAYLRTLVGPMDGYWETAVIGLAPHYIMWKGGKRVGYFAVQKGRLLQFFVVDAALPEVPALFADVLTSANIHSAAVSTIEPAFLALCLDRQTAVSVNSYLFQDHHTVHPTLSAYPQAEFRPGTMADIDQLVQFYHENDEYEDTEAIETGAGGHEPYTRSLVENEQVFLLTNNDEILGIGECRISETQKPYADVGMIANNQYRRQGIGTFLLAQLKEYCYSLHVKPICSCTFDNMASRKTIEKAGFITQYRILDIQFH
jgi:predicted acetyltransferase